MNFREFLMKTAPGKSTKGTDPAWRPDYLPALPEGWWYCVAHCGEVAHVMKPSKRRKSLAGAFTGAEPLCAAMIEVATLPPYQGVRVCMNCAGALKRHDKAKSERELIAASDEALLAEVEGLPLHYKPRVTRTAKILDIHVCLTDEPENHIEGDRSFDFIHDRHGARLVTWAGRKALWKDKEATDTLEAFKAAIAALKGRLGG